MFRNALAVGVALLVSACGSTSKCVAGESSSCTCTSGRSGAQVCAADGTFGACQCAATACNANNCSGCCDDTGTCLSGATEAACGGAGSTCAVCGNNQSCREGACVTTSSSCGTNSCLAAGSCQQSFDGHVGDRCGAGGACATCAATEQCVAGTCTPFKRLFATRTTYDGNLGGLSGADAKCALAASAAGLPGTYVAWLSDASTDALSRITADGPWFSVLNSSFDSSKSARRMFNNKANLQTLPLDNYLSWADEIGDSFEGEIWTGTTTGGTRAANTCTGWTSVATLSNSGGTGRLGGTSGVAVWTEHTADGNCSVGNSLLCIEN